MIKKPIISFVTLFLIFTLVGCGEKLEPTYIEPININFNVANVNNQTVSFQYPTDDWQQKDSFNPDIIKVLLYGKNENLDPTTNITIGSTSTSQNLILEDYVKLIPEHLEKSSPGTKVSLAELRKVNDIVFSYLEMKTKVTEEDLEYGLQKGIFTEETIKAKGGKEAFLNQPEVKQIQMSVSFQDKITNITATYSNDNEKEIILKAMLTMVQTATLL